MPKISTDSLKVLLADKKVQAILAFGILLTGIIVWVVMIISANYTNKDLNKGNNLLNAGVSSDDAIFKVEKSAKYVENTLAFKSRDIFEPFETGTQAASTTATSSISTTTSFDSSTWDGKSNNTDDDSTTNTDSTPTPTPTPTPKPTPKPPVPPPPPPAPKTVSIMLESVFQLGTEQIARISVDKGISQDYSEGDTVGVYFEIVDVDPISKTVVLLYGDERIVLNQGFTLTKEIVD